ncbi:unnamed protein product [Eretmochelys imbricata]
MNNGFCNNHSIWLFFRGFSIEQKHMFQLIFPPLWKLWRSRPETTPQRRDNRIDRLQKPTDPWEPRMGLPLRLRQKELTDLNRGLSELYSAPSDQKGRDRLTLQFTSLLPVGKTVLYDTKYSNDIIRHASYQYDFRFLIPQDAGGVGSGSRPAFLVQTV